MKPPCCSKLCVLVLAVVPLAGCASTGEPSPPPPLPYYEVVDLGSLGGEYTLPEAINNETQIVGYSELEPDRTWRHAFLWENGKMVDLFPGDELSSEAYDINDRGNIVGMRSDAGGDHPQDDAFALIDGALREDLHGPELWGRAMAIDEGDQVLLSVYPGPMILVDGDERFPIRADINGDALNESGQVGGWWWGGSPRTWDSDGLKILPTATIESGFVEDINDAGVAVGYLANWDGPPIVEGPPSSYFVAARWSRDGELSVLLEGNRAHGINAAGHVVGEGRPYHLTEDAGYYRAWLWRDGQAVDLNTRIPYDSGWFLSTAEDVNDHGEIVGTGLRDGEWAAYLLRPVPAYLVEIELLDDGVEIVLGGPPDSELAIDVAEDRRGVHEFRLGVELEGAQRLGDVVTDKDGRARIALPGHFGRRTGSLLVQIVDVESGRRGVIQRVFL